MMFQIQKEQWCEVSGCAKKQQASSKAANVVVSTFYK